MKLEKLKIFSDYRNLKGMDIKFPSNKDTVVFIGNNGTGKSNILEALSEIFGKLLYNDVANLHVYFRLIYELDGYKIVVKNKAEGFSFKVNENEYPEVQVQYLPEKVVCSYSGEDIRLFENCYKDYQKRYSIARRDTKNEALKMLYVGREVWMIVLLIMIINNIPGTDNDKFLRKLGHDLQNVKVTLSFNSKERAKWKKVNLYTNFVEQLEKMMSDNGCIDISTLKARGLSSIALYDMFLGISDIIESVSVKFGDGVDAMLLSEGEKKMMVIRFMLECLSDEKTLVLMDEPDSHIHISRKLEMKNCFENIPNRNNLITTHSPSLATAFEKDCIIMLDKDDTGHVSIVDKTKQQLVADLTDGKWTAQTQNMFLASNNDIIFIEGPTDEDYLAASLKMFQAGGKFANMAFEYLPCGGAAQLQTLINKFVPKPNQMLFAFWDWDDAGEKAMQKIFGDQTTRFNFGKAQKKNNVWFAFYPRRKRPRIGWPDGFNVEDYFIKAIVKKYFLSFTSLNNLLSKDTFKQNLAKDCRNGKFSEKDLCYFHLVFDLIEEIKHADFNGKNKL